LSQGVTDRLIWKWSASGQYSSSLAYATMFHGQSTLIGAKELWKVKASNEFIFFFWLAMQDPCWISERLTRHGLRNNGPCTQCDQQTETIDHLLLICVYKREVWFQGFQPCGWQHLTPQAEDNLSFWWCAHRRLSSSLDGRLSIPYAWSLRVFGWKGMPGCLGIKVGQR
jgi:hypothetical protein